MKSIFLWIEVYFFSNGIVFSSYFVKQTISNLFQPNVINESVGYFFALGYQEYIRTPWTKKVWESWVYVLPFKEIFTNTGSPFSLTKPSTQKATSLSLRGKRCSIQVSLSGFPENLSLPHPPKKTIPWQFSVLWLPSIWSLFLLEGGSIIRRHTGRQLHSCYRSQNSRLLLPASLLLRNKCPIHAQPTRYIAPRTTNGIQRSKTLGVVWAWWLQSQHSDSRTAEAVVPALTSNVTTAARTEQPCASRTLFPWEL